MRVLVQPDDGIRLLINGINHARRSIEIAIFRFDVREVERALATAVTRGVSVHALIAHTNRAGEENLRKLELRLLAAGVTVSRTADDLLRYHGKFMIVDRRDLYLLAFNWTHIDIERSRSFGLVVSNAAMVREAVRLFEADSGRHPYEPGLEHFVVSPLNARKALAGFIQCAKKSLLIYDPKVSDPAMIALLAERAKRGVEIRILGRLMRKIPGATAHKIGGMRLHTRTIIRDGKMAFVGSQSLRSLELDSRREVCIIFRHPAIIGRLVRTFTADWTRSAETALQADNEAPAARVAQKVAKLVAKELPQVTPVLNGAVKELVGNALEVELNPAQVEAVVKDAVKEAVKSVVDDMVQELVEQEEAG